MRLNNPLGLIALACVPILIAIYVIKSQYAEQTIASTYIWELSEKFLKRRRKINPFSGIAKLIVQILAVTAIALALAQPVFTIPHGANDYCFVLDGSGSMNTVSAYGKSRFDEGKDRIAEIINDTKKGSKYTLVVAGDNVTEVFRDVTDKSYALNMLGKVKSGWGAAECTDAAGIVQSYFTSESSPVLYLITDKEYDAKNCNVINLSENDDNYALAAYSFKKTPVDGVYVTQVSGQVVSCSHQAFLNIELYIDGIKTAEKRVSVKKQTPTDFSFETTVTSFSDLQLKIVNDDGLPQDNVGIMYASAEESNNKTLIVSDAPGYLEFLLRASGKTAVETMTTKAYSEKKNELAGYDLYVFDTFTDVEKLPKEAPKNASVWFFNLKASVANTGFGYRGDSVAEGDEYYEPEYTAGSSSLLKKLTENVKKQSFAVKQYSQYMTNRNFTSILTCGGDDLIFVGDNENGNRQVVFAFDLHDSNLPLKSDYIMLMNNLLNYSFPSILEKTDYTVGEDMEICVPAGYDNIILESPSGKLSYPDFSAATAYVHLTETGTYSLKIGVNGSERNYSVFVRLPAQESYLISKGDMNVYKLTESSASDGFYDGLLAYYILLVLAFLFDWGVYCYEQYQLR